MKQIYYCEWVDATAYSGWENPEIYDVSTAKAVGFVVKENKDIIVLAAAISDEYSNAVIAIPKRWITKKKKLRV